ncbi:MAG TPA: glycosyltransferase family 2 protein [Cyclobacteriaceae bacterium]|nr:glycosyltransferase family 2 protein [Cyclobacteriaceae bacterium]
MTHIAVVILNYNGSGLLRQFLPSVIQFSATAKIVVADNGSGDNSLEVLRTEFPQVEIIPIATNLGFCGGYNYALKKVQADYFLLLNSDVEVTDGWLAPLQKALDENPSAVAVQPRILSYNDKKYFEYAGAGGGFIDTLGYPFCRGRLFYFMEEDQGQYNDNREIFWSSGACMMVRSAQFLAVDGFDEDFFAHMEEIDLCWRLQRAGYSILYAGDSVVYHLGGGTLSVSNPRKTYLNFKNGLSLIYKNMSAGELLYKFPIRIVLDWIASIKFALSGAFAASMAVLTAHWHFFSNFKREKSRRNKSRSLGFRQPATLYKESVVWQFFIRGKKRFTELN